MSGGDVVTTHGISKRYGRETALDGVNLRVPEGAVYVLVGANGAGKSTTLKVLMNLERADAGTAEIHGLDTVRRGPEARAKKDGWVPRPEDEGWPNAGFFINAGPIVTGWPTSIEVQGHFGEAGSVFGVRGGKVSGAKRGPIVKNRIPFGDWDKYEITSKDGKITVVLNGQLVNEGHDIYPAEGNICLQSEGWEVHYRNVAIKELK